MSGVCMLAPLRGGNKAAAEWTTQEGRTFWPCTQSFPTPCALNLTGHRPGKQVACCQTIHRPDSRQTPWTPPPPPTLPSLRALPLPLHPVAAALPRGSRRPRAAPWDLQRSWGPCLPPSSTKEEAKCAPAAHIPKKPSGPLSPLRVAGKGPVLLAGTVHLP